MIDSEIWVLILMCAIGVVAFFALWAILAYVIKLISERKNGKKDGNFPAQLSSNCKSDETDESNP